MYVCKRIDYFTIYKQRSIKEIKMELILKYKLQRNIKLTEKYKPNKYKTNHFCIVFF